MHYSHSVRGFVGRFFGGKRGRMINVDMDCITLYRRFPRINTRSRDLLDRKGGEKKNYRNTFFLYFFQDIGKNGYGIGAENAKKTRSLAGEVYSASIKTGDHYQIECSDIEGCNLFWNKKKKKHCIYRKRGDFSHNPLCFSFLWRMRN